METNPVDNELKQDMDDSGCVQDEGAAKWNKLDEEFSILDLCDDVLLHILKFCPPRELKALGYTCTRLGRLIQDRALWKHVDARSERMGVNKLNFYLGHMIRKELVSLKIHGFAETTEGCLGYVHTSRRSPAEEKAASSSSSNSSGLPPPLMEDNISVMRELRHEDLVRLPRLQATARATYLSRIRSCPSWPDDVYGRAGPQKCAGPQFTLSEKIFTYLKEECPNLTVLNLEYVNLNCSLINLASFPHTTKKLSLCGSRFYNLIVDRSFLTKINEFLPDLEQLDVSFCDWFEPSALLPLSKHPKLTHLVARHCYRLSEFVAYASLTARYGFKTLKVLDLRNSPVGDSEVSALGWLPLLEELWLSAYKKPHVNTHVHYHDDKKVPQTEFEEWEYEVPDYFEVNPLFDMSSSDDSLSETVEVEEPEVRSRRYNIYRTGSCIVQNLPYFGHILSDGHSYREEANALENAQNAVEVIPQPEQRIVAHIIPQMPNVVQIEPEMVQIPIVIAGPSGRTQNGRNDYRRRQNQDHDNEQGEASSSHNDQQPRGSNAANVSKNEDSGSKDKERSDNKTNSGPAAGGHNIDDSETKTNNGKAKKAKKYKPDFSAKDRAKRMRLGATLESSESEDEDDRRAAEAEATAMRNEIRIMEANNNVHHPGGASTSREGQPERYVRFRRNQNPTYGNCPLDHDHEYNCVQYSSVPEFIRAINNSTPEQQEQMRWLTNWARRYIDEWTRERNEIIREANQNGANDDGPNRNRPAENMQNQNGPDENRHQNDNDMPNQNAPNELPNQNESNENSTNQHMSNENVPNQQLPNQNERNDNRPIIYRPNDNIPNDNRPNDGRPTIYRPSDNRPNDNGSSEFRPYIYRPHEYRPNDNRPDENMPNDDRPNDNRLHANRPHADRPHDDRSNDDRPNDDGPQDDRPNDNNYPRFHAERMRGIEYLVEPRHHVLCVSVGSNLNTYRFPRDVFEERNFFDTHIDASSLITDFSIRRFGRADGEDVNFVHIGPNGPFLMGNTPRSRPDRSNLRVLSVTGYRNITDRSLNHLITAAPLLSFIDFSETNVTERGVEHFKSLRPDCEVKFSKIKKPE